MWRRRRFRALALTGLTCLSGGCDEPVAGEGQALKAALSAAETAALDTQIDAAALGQVSVQHRVYRRSFARNAARLGDVLLTLDTDYTLAPPAAGPMKLIERRVAGVSHTGDFSLDHRMAWRIPDEQGDGGRRCWFLAGQLYQARDVGPATRIPERSGETERCLDAAIEPLESWLQLFEAETVAEAGAGETILGRETVHLHLTAAPPPDGQAPLPKSLPAFWQENETHTATVETAGVPGPRTWLLASHGVLRSLEADLLLDAETSLPLRAELVVRMAVKKTGQSADLELHLRLKTEARKGPLERPAEIERFGPRARIFREETAILGAPSAPTSGAVLPKPGDAPPLSAGFGESEAAPSGPSSEPSAAPKPPAKPPKKPKH